MGAIVSAVACWRAPALPNAVLRLQDQLRQVLVQEEEADRSNGDAPARRLREVGWGKAGGLNGREVRTERPWVEDGCGASSRRRWARRGGARACVGYVRARPAALCAKRARCFGEEGCPRARGARSRRWGAETTHRNAELQDGLESRRHGCQPQRYAKPSCDVGTITRDTFRNHRFFTTKVRNIETSFLGNSETK